MHKKNLLQAASKVVRATWLQFKQSCASTQDRASSYIWQAY